MCQFWKSVIFVQCYLEESFTAAVETPLHYFLKCKLYNIHRPIMMQTYNIVHHLSDSTLMHIILEGNGNEFENVEMITAVSDFIYIILGDLSINSINYLTTSHNLYNLFICNHGNIIMQISFYLLYC